MLCCANENLSLHISSVQNSSFHVLVLLPLHFGAFFCPISAHCGACGQTAGAQSGTAGGSNDDLFSVGYTKRPGSVPRRRCSYWWALQSSFKASSYRPRLHSAATLQTLHWVNSKLAGYCMYYTTHMHISEKHKTHY